MTGQVDPASMTTAARHAWANVQLDHAIELSDADRDDEAHALLVHVARYLSPDDPSGVAGRLWHVLGVAWRARTHGARLDNLLWSKDLLERARTHKHRRADMLGYRLAITRDQLGVTLRQLAPLARDDHEESRVRMVKRAEALFRAAIEWYRRARHTLGLSRQSWENELLLDRAGVELNLANLLLDEGRFDEAIRLQEDVVRALESARYAPPRVLPMLAQLKLNLAGTLARRNRPRDRPRIDRLLAYTRAHGSTRTASAATLLIAEQYAQAGDDENAVRALSAIQPGMLDPRGERRVMDALIALEAHEHALVMGSRFIGAAFERRLQTVGPTDADAEAAHAQWIAAVLARVHVSRDELPEAFLLLENSVGARFYETVRGHLLTPKTRLDAELARLCTIADTCGIWCHQWAGLLQSLAMEDADTRQQFLAEFEGALEHPPHWPAPGRWGRAVLARAVAAVAAARQAADPAAALLTAARVLTDEGRRYQALLERRDRDMSRRWSIGLLSREELESIARSSPTDVFIRLSLVGDLLAVACCWRDGHMHWAATRIEVSPERHEIMSALTTDVASAGDGRAADLFDTLDLSPIFPPQRGGTAVFLPSRLAAPLPLAALGPPGRTPLDHFDGVRVMIGLDLLRLPPTPHVPRDGRVAVVGPNTLRADHAFEDALPEERHIASSSATIEAVTRALETADVVAIYAHGRHGDDFISGVELADGVYPPPFGRVADHVGLERIELWACRGADSRELDPRGYSTVDELPSLDASLLGSGVRSVVAATLPVREGVTAEIARVYRQGIAHGATADVALAQAMRWWRDHRRPTIGDPSTMTTEQRALNCPSAWAAFRVLGTCERRPDEPLSYDPRRPLTSDEETELERLLSEPVEDEQPFDRNSTHNVAEQIELDISATLDDIEREPAVVDHVLVLADLYRNRLVADHRHNLVRALAWVHDALATPTLTANEARMLRSRAIHLWLDLAIEASGHESLIGRTQAWSAIRPRVEKLLGQLDPADSWGARAMLMVAGLGPEEPGEVERVEAAFSNHPPFEALVVEDLIAACEVGARAPEALDDTLDALIRAAVHRLDYVEGTIDHIRTHHRLGAALHQLLRAAELPIRGRVAEDGLTARERWLAISGGARSLFESLGADAGPLIDKARDQFLQDRDEAVWGRMHPLDCHRWRGTGGHGFWYRFVIANLAGVAANRQSDHRTTALHLLACTHLAADLRTQQHNRWSMFLGGTPKDMALDLWSSLPVLLREEALDDLVDAALVPGAQLDPFTDDITPSTAGTGTPPDRAAWAVMTDALDPLEEPCPGRTTAGRVARMLALLDRTIEATWSRLHDLAGELPGGEAFITRASAMSTPPLRIVSIHQQLAAADPQVAHLSLGQTPEGWLYALLAHRDTYRFTHVKNEPAPSDLMALFCIDWATRELVESELQDNPLDPLPHFVDGWDRVIGLLAALVGPLVEQLLAAGVKTINVLAPGQLRPIPWLGLPVGGRALADHLAARGGRVALLPALEWDVPPAPGRGLDAALVADPDARSGPISAVQSALGIRRLDRYGGGAPRTTELNQLTGEQHPIARLQLVGEGYEVGGIGATASLEFGSGPIITPRSIGHLRFVPGAEVEIWAATDRRGVDDLRKMARDRLPAMVRAALRAGARGVLDLAWPIDPLLRTLLIEQFTLATRREGQDGARAALTAVSRVRAMVRRALEAADPFLQTIDMARADSWSRAGLSSGRCPSLADGPSVDRVQLAAVLDAHLAALRWWGA